MNQRLRIAVIFILFFLVVEGSAIFIHESVHKVINTGFGCRNSVFGANWQGFYTLCVDKNFVCNDYCRLAQSINEVVGYSITQFLVIIIILLLMSVSTKSDEGVIEDVI